MSVFCFFVLCLCSDQSKYIALFWVTIFLIYVVFQAYFWSLVAVFNFPIALFLLLPVYVFWAQALI